MCSIATHCHLIDGVWTYMFRAYVGIVLARKDMMETYGHTLETQKPQLRSFTENRVVDGLYESSWVPKQSRNCSIFGLFLTIFGQFWQLLRVGSHLVTWRHRTKLQNTHFLKKKKRFVTYK